MRTLLLSGAFALLFVPDLSAQTHPCDGTQPTSFAVQRSTVVRVAFCHSQKEDDGVTPIPIGQIRFRLVTTSNVLIADLGLLSPLTGPNANGDYYFESPTRTFTADTNLYVSAEYLGSVVPSTPILVDVRGGPKAPSGVRVVISQ